MPISPKQQLYNHVFAQSQGLGFFVVDTMQQRSPANPYPFVHVGEVTGVDMRAVKGFVRGTFGMTVHVWALASDRGTFADMVFQVEQLLRSEHVLDGFTAKPASLSSNELIDDTTDDLLYHGAITAEFLTY